MVAGIGFQFGSGIKQFAQVDLNEEIVIMIQMKFCQIPKTSFKMHWTVLFVQKVY